MTVTEYLTQLARLVFAFEHETGVKVLDTTAVNQALASCEDDRDYAELQYLSATLWTLHRNAAYTSRFDDIVEQQFGGVFPSEETD